MTEQDALVADVLDGYTPIGEVPDNFAEFVADKIASRPSPAPPVETDRLILEKLDEILTLLRGQPNDNGTDPIGLG